MKRIEIIVVALAAIIEALIGIASILMWLADHNRRE